MLRATADLAGYPLIIFGLSTGNLTKLQEKKPMLIDLKKEYGIDAAVMILWGPTEEAIAEDLKTNGLPLKLKGEPVHLLGPTGEFPEGKARPDDRGELQMAVGIENGKVVVHFGTAVNWIGLPAQNAIELGELIKARGVALMQQEAEAQ